VRPTLILGAIVLAAFAFRVHLLGAQELRGDEGFTWNYVRSDPIAILATIVREGDPQPPLHYWLQWAWLQLTGDSEFAMRAWSAFLSLVLIPLMYQVGRRLWRTEVGLLAAGLTAVHPQQIWLAQDVRNMYQLALAALLVSTLLLVRLMAASGTARMRDWLGYVACGAIAMYSHYYALFFLVAHGAYVVLHPARRGLGRWVTAGLAIAALVGPWALVIVPVYLGGQLRDPGRLSFTAYAPAALGDLIAGPAFPDSVKLVFIAAAALLAGAAIISLAARQARHVAAFLIASVAVTVLGIYAVTATRATFNTFYLAFASPAAYLLLAGGVFVLYRRMKPLGVGVILLGLIVYGLGLRNHYFDSAYSKNRGMRDVAAHLALAARPGDVYLTSTPDPAMVYYLRGLDLPFHLIPGRPDFDPQQVDDALESLLAGRVWLVPARALDPEGYVPGRLLDTALLAEDRAFNKLRLMLFLPLTEAVPLDARFGDGIRLTGYHLTPNRLTLIWTADAAPRLDYTIFVHALADDTFQLTGHDAPPHIPTSHWQPGQPVVDVHEFEIPTGQPVTLVAGLYLPASPHDPLALEAGPQGAPDSALVTRTAP
jgi:mannosyltransferase